MQVNKTIYIMKQKLRLNEAQLRNIIKESVKKILMESLEDDIAFEDDLTYDSINTQAYDTIHRMMQKGQPIRWMSVAEEMGFRLETLNTNDMETLKQAIEDAMFEYDNPYYREDADFLYDWNKLKELP